MWAAYLIYLTFALDFLSCTGIWPLVLTCVKWGQTWDCAATPIPVPLYITAVSTYVFWTIHGSLFKYIARACPSGIFEFLRSPEFLLFAWTHHEFIWLSPKCLAHQCLSLPGLGMHMLRDPHLPSLLLQYWVRWWLQTPPVEIFHIFIVSASSIILPEPFVMFRSCELFGSTEY